MNDELLTISELANRLKVPKSWIYARTRVKGEGSIPLHRVGKYLRFRENEILQWLKNQQQKNEV